MPSNKKAYTSSQKNSQVKLLIFGILLIGFALYKMQTVFTSRSDLREIRGTVRAADIYVSTVGDRRGRESRQSELIFYLNERQQKFCLTANIGKAYQNDRFRKILAGINQADTLSVWVDKDEVDEYEPTVFQIDNEHKTLLEFEKVRRGGSPVVIVCLVCGIASILGFLWFRYPKVLNRMWN